jgi:hypothetical protein
MWAHYCRHNYYSRMTTTNILESFNGTVKHILESYTLRYKKSRIDLLLKILLLEAFKNPEAHFVQKHQAEAKKLKSTTRFARLPEVARMQLEKSLLDSTEIPDGAVMDTLERHLYQVISPTSESCSYLVDIAKFTCTCPWYEFEALTCKHIFKCATMHGMKMVVSLRIVTDAEGINPEDIPQPAFRCLHNDQIRQAQQQYTRRRAAYINADEDEDEECECEYSKLTEDENTSLDTTDHQHEGNLEDILDSYDGGFGDDSEEHNDLSEMASNESAQEEGDMSASEILRTQIEFRQVLRHMPHSMISASHDATNPTIIRLMQAYIKHTQEMDVMLSSIVYEGHAKQDEGYKGFEDFVPIKR